MALESCKWVQPFPRERERLAPQAHNMIGAGNGQRFREPEGVARSGN